MKRLAVIAMGIGLLVLSACTTAPDTATDRAVLHNDATAAVANFIQRDPGMKDFLQNAYGYAIFPGVGKGGVGVGGAYGRGEVYERGKLVGYATMTQATVGLQLGGQEYSEILVFQTREALHDFEVGDLTGSAQLSAVAIQTGVAESTKYKDGVAIFVDLQGGLMGEASVGGQKFVFEPL